ncbi:MAG: glycosyltransferase family 25 protein [Rhodothermaceae bacterium]|nr:glycosyltransferase family 25 protein [Rhodothermaceae bacterium]
MQLPVFVINLERRPDRLATITGALDRIGLAFTRIPAIDGQALDGDPAILRMGAGHVACARSHYKATAAFLDTGAAAALILEEDVEVSPTVSALIFSSLDWWPEGHGLVKLDSTIQEHKRIWLGRPVGCTPDGRELKPILRSHLGAYGYMVDRRTAAEVSALAPETPLPIDHLLFNLTNSAFARRIKPLQAVPAAIRHLPYEQVGSDTGSSRVDGEKRWKGNRIARLLPTLGVVAWALAGRARRRLVSFGAPLNWR